MVFVEGGMWIRIKKTELYSFKSLVGVRTRSFKIIIWGNRPSKFCMQHYIRYDITLYTLTITLTITFLYITLTIYRYHNGNIRYDIPLLMTLYEALPIVLDI